jgi:hypothetical protein
VTQGTDRAACDGHGGHAEEAQLLQRAAVELLDDGPGVGALDLEAVVAAGDAVAVGTGGAAAVHLDVQVGVTTGLTVVEQPVGGRCATHVGVLVLCLAEEDAVADHVAAGGGWHVLLGLVDLELGHGVDRRVGDQLDGIGTLQEHVVHVVGLIVEHRGVTPGLLFLDPVGEVRRDHRVDVGTDLRVAQQVHRIGGIQQLLKVLCFVAHVLASRP